MLWTDVMAPVVEKVVHRLVGIVDDVDLVPFDPHFDADECDIHVQRAIQLVVQSTFAQLRVVITFCYSGWHISGRARSKAYSELLLKKWGSQFWDRHPKITDNFHSCKSRYVWYEKLFSRLLIDNVCSKTVNENDFFQQTILICDLIINKQTEGKMRPKYPPSWQCWRCPLFSVPLRLHHAGKTWTVQTRQFQSLHFTD